MDAYASYLTRGVPEKAPTDDASLKAPTDDASLFLAPVFGTMERGDPSMLYNTTKAAIAAGYRHFDFAEHYLTQEPAGRAIRDSGLPRDAVWITSKIDGLPAGDYAAVRARVVRMLELSQLAHFDLLLVHYPLPAGTDLAGDPSALATGENWQWFAANVGDAWRNMARLRRDGLARRVGVSNFYAQHLDALAPHAAAAAGGIGGGGADGDDGARVFANELFIDAAHPETELVEAMARRGIRALAYRPVAFVANYALLDGVTEKLDAAAAATGSADARALVLRWLLARGIACVASSGDPAHIRANCVSVAGGFDIDAARAGLAAAAEQAEMIDMCGGCDEYAAAFKSMGDIVGRALPLH